MSWRTTQVLSFSWFNKQKTIYNHSFFKAKNDIREASTFNQRRRHPLPIRMEEWRTQFDMSIFMYVGVSNNNYYLLVMKLRGSFLKTLESTTVSIEPTTVAIEPASPRRPMIARLSRTNRLLTYSPSPQITCMKIINNVFTFSPLKIKGCFS